MKRGLAVAASAGLLVLIAGALSAQNVRMKGRVFDALTGRPVPVAVVEIRGA